MSFIADLHIHSRFSMATSRALNIAHLSAWAKRKGIQVLGTGDFTHPKWREELERDLTFDEESGLYRSRSASGNLAVPPDSREPLFCLQTEISSIYKKNGKTRKVHNLVFAPDLETAEKISRKLARIGNINSDGRPILGLDSRDLLELVLESSPRSILIPAHIWTPWFSLFGSKSGFDDIKECYEDLTSHIFALETGLSSDPAMNRHVSSLDAYALISNSDAHSGPNLGREANLFSGQISYDGMFEALRVAARRENSANAKCKFLGTCEFYPEEGKYHLDGHRACGVALEPRESLKKGNICPACGKTLTIGVLHRVMELADRLEPAALPHEPPTRMLVPLPEVIGQILGQKPSSKKVQERYEKTLQELGPEMDILCQYPEAQIRSSWEALGEAVSRLRSGKVQVNSGFDGQYGEVKIFSDEERKELQRGKIHSLPGLEQSRPSSRLVHSRQLAVMERLEARHEALPPPALSPAQLAAVAAGPHAVFIIAGPGAGKTRCLISRIERLAQETAADKILAITFTRRAAREMSQRLAMHFPNNGARPFCDTLHALAWHVLKEKYPARLLDEAEAARLFQEANARLSPKEAGRAWQELNLAREKCLPLTGELAHMAASYVNYKRRELATPLVDFCDLLEMLTAEDLCGRWSQILVDEMQDLSPLQLKAISRLLPQDGSGFFGIGDPDQAIYSFRGGLDNILDSLQTLWPAMEIRSLEESWRSSQKILNMARSVLGEKSRSSTLRAARTHNPILRILEAEDDKAEAFAIAREISRLLGPTAHTMLDTASGNDSLSPSDLAILVRLKAQIPVLSRALAEQGIPFSAPEAEGFWHDASCLELIDSARVSEEPPPPEQYLLEDRFASLCRSGSFASLLDCWRQCGNWKKFFEELAWLEEAELLSEKSQSVRILTMHASKGLEFRNVFVAGLEKGLLPLDHHLLQNAPRNEAPSEDEERRLLYVALTRASHSVIISYAHSRRLYGRKLTLAASPFLASMESFCVRSKIISQSRRTAKSLSLIDLSGNTSP